MSQPVPRQFVMQLPVCNANYSKRAPVCEVITDSNDTGQSVAVKEPKKLNNSEASANSDPSIHVDEQVKGSLYY